MTPKEKAEELFNKYATYVVMWAGDINTTHQNCKHCALIAINELIIVCKYYNDTQAELNYWHEVEQEIQNL
jgi:hypothetical protein